MASEASSVHVSESSLLSHGSKESKEKDVEDQVFDRASEVPSKDHDSPIT